MAQSPIEKRKSIARRTVVEAMKLWDAVTELAEIAEEKATAGNFEDTDFVDGDLQHLTPFLVGTFLDNDVDTLLTFLTSEGVKQRLLEARR